MSTFLKKAIVLVMTMAMVFSVSLTAFALEATKTEGDLKVTLSTDKDEYKAGEKITLKLVVENIGTDTLTNVKISYDIPDDIKELLSEDSELPTEIKEIKAGEKIEYKSEGIVVEDSKNAGGGTKTGDTASTVLFIVFAVIASVVAVGAYLFKDKIKKYVSMVMIAVMFVGLLAAIGPILSAKADTEEKSFTVTVKPIVNDQEEEISATITYEAEADDTDPGDTDPGNNGGNVDGETKSRVTVHDPSIVKDPETGIYYVFGTHMGWAKSTDLVNWTTFTNNINSNYNTIFATDATWSAKGTARKNQLKGTSETYGLSGNLWAPDVIYNEDMGKWCMYMSVNGDYWYSSIVLLTADNIEGPYTREGVVVYSGFTNATEAAATDFKQVTGTNEVDARYAQNRNGNMTYSLNAIDPCVFYDEDGTLWMSYGSWFGGIYMLKLDKNSGLRDYTNTYQTVANTSDIYQGIKIAGGEQCSGEASYIQYIDGYYYLYMTYGGLDAKGGYNMRVFRSENPTGPYVDLSGDSAKFTAGANNINGTVGNRVMSYYKWSFMNYGYCAQGHNSAFVDDDGRTYLVYHTRFNDGTEGHQVRVHQQFVNEDGWLVTAPFEYTTGETLSKTGYSASDVEGKYEVLFHKKDINYAGLECTAGVELNINADGTVTGAKTGTWAWSSKGSPYVTMTIGSTTYKGVFLEQKMEETNISTYAFTLLGSDEINVWGYRYPADEIIDMAAEKITLPTATFIDVTLQATGLYGSTITWKSNNAAVLSATGKMTRPANDTTVKMTATISFGGKSKDFDYNVKVFAGNLAGSTKVLVGEYFTNTPTDLSKAVKGTYTYPNPFNKANIAGVEIYNGVSIQFDAQRAGVNNFLSTILGFNAGAAGGLYFTEGSYLGYNATGGYFDANADTAKWLPGTDFMGTSKVTVEIKILPTGYEVYVGGVKKYDQSNIGSLVPGNKGTLTSFASILAYLNNTATDLTFGWGAWWETANDCFHGTISNVKCYVEPIVAEDTSGYAYYQSYSSVSNIANEWISDSAQTSITLANDGDAHGNYMKYVSGGDSGNRGAYTTFPSAGQLTKGYCIETDVKLTSGNVADRSVSQFVIAGTDMAYASGGINAGIATGYILKLSTVMPTTNTKSTTWYVNDSKKTVTIPEDTWIHIKTIVDADGDVQATISYGSTTVIIDTEVNGSGVLKGLYLLRGRGTGTASVDNIKVKTDSTDVPGLPDVAGSTAAYTFKRDETVGTKAGTTYTLAWWDYSNFYGTKLSGDFDVTYKIHHESEMVENYHSLAASFTTNLTRTNHLDEIGDPNKIGDLYIRGDNFISSKFAGSTTDIVSDFDWANFKTMFADAEVELNAKRVGTTITVTMLIEGANGKTAHYTVTATDCPTADMMMYLGGEACQLKISEVTFATDTQSSIILADTSTVGTKAGTTYTLAWWDYSNFYGTKLSGDFDVTYKIHHESGVAENYHSLAASFTTNLTRTNHLDEIGDPNKIGDLYIRGDNFVSSKFAGSTTDIVSNFDWANFKAMFADAEVELNAKRVGTTITVTMLIEGANGKTANYTVTATDCPTDDMMMYLGGESCYLQLSEITIK